MGDNKNSIHEVNLNPFNRVPIEIRVTVGKAHPSIKDLLQLNQNSILTLDRSISDPVELYIGDKLIAYGELEEIEGENEGQLAVRLTKVADLDDDL